MLKVFCFSMLAKERGWYGGLSLDSHVDVDVIVYFDSMIIA
jgi:hypothetical protein